MGGLDMGLADPEMAELLFLEGNHFLTLIETPSMILEGDWAVSYAPSQNNARGKFTFQDAISTSHAEGDGYAMISYADGWTIISFPGAYLLQGSVVQQVLAKALNCRAFYVHKDAQNAALLSFIQEDGAILRAMQGTAGGVGGGPFTFIGDPLSIEKGLGDFTALQSGFELLKRWGGPEWLTDPAEAVLLDKARHYAVTPKDGAVQGDGSAAARAFLEDNKARAFSSPDHPMLSLAGDAAAEDAPDAPPPDPRPSRTKRWVKRCADWASPWRQRLSRKRSSLPPQTKPQDLTEQPVAQETVSSPNRIARPKLPQSFGTPGFVWGAIICFGLVFYFLYQ